MKLLIEKRLYEFEESISVDVLWAKTRNDKMHVQRKPLISFIFFFSVQYWFFGICDEQIPNTNTKYKHKHNAAEIQKLFPLEIENDEK